MVVEPKRHIHLAVDPLGQSHYVITARCGHQFSTALRPGWRWPEDMCQIIERHLDYHERLCFAEQQRQAAIKMTRTAQEMLSPN